MSTPTLKPEEQARALIDEMLVEAGWVVQNYADVDFAARPGVAVREFPTPKGPMDYLLVADQKVVGSLEAKKAGTTLSQVELQADRYDEGFKKLIVKKPLPRYRDELPFHYISTGVETRFTSRRDPIKRPREVFFFHRPETLAAWAAEDMPYRARLRQMPPLNDTTLRSTQAEAIQNLELSLGDDKPKALAAITMGGGKTRFAVAETFRLLSHAKATRVLFLVDRVSLGDQAKGEFLSYVSPDDGRKFGDLYEVEVLKSSKVKKSTNVLICTIQRLYAMLRDDPDEELFEDLDEVSSFELSDSGPAAEVTYNQNIPIEFFDLMFVDECHRSIYGRWRQVIDYFDGSLVGLTATPTPTTMAFFDDNVIAEYSQEQSVFDGVNVGQQLYRIRTKVGTGGDTINAGEWVQVRDKATHAIELKQLDDDFIYDAKKLDRAVLNKSQIRTVVKTFRDRVRTEIFPGRDEVPKTIFFAKHDQHAEDILAIIWQEFGKGSEFARKITYKAEGTVEQNIKEFRNDPQMRIAVTVEQIGTGTDIKAVECLVFMRMVGSRVLLNQMRGRAVRTIGNDDFWAVTPGAAEKGQTKDYSVLVDCVGLSDEDVVLKETDPTGDPSVPLKKLLSELGMGMTDDKTLKTVAQRLVRLNDKLNDEEKDEFAATAGGSTIVDIVGELRDAIDPNFQLATAQAQTGEDEPSEEQVAAARKELVKSAIAQLRRGEVREKIASLQTVVATTLIHSSSHDELTEAGFAESPAEATSVLDDWRAFMDEHKDEYLALKVYYSQPYRRRPTLDEIKELARVIARPPLNLTPERLWAAYETLDADRVRGHGGKLDADLVRVIRYTLEEDDELVPFADAVEQRFLSWLGAQEQLGREFSDEQLRWLTMVANFIGESMQFDPTEDCDLPPFSLEGGANAASRLFGADLVELVNDLNEKLVAA